MINQLSYFFLFLVEVVLLFTLSRKTINNMFIALRRVFKEDRLVFSIISLIFLPGTILHEFAHFITAIILFLNVREIKILPEWEKNYIKLGRVLYEKKDFVRGILVGIAPIFVGLFFFWWLSYFKIFPHKNIFLNLFLVYVIFAVSSTMFSSKQDLIDLVYLIPLIVIVLLIVYLFNIKISVNWQESIIFQGFVDVIKDISLFLSLSLGINFILLLIFKAFEYLERKL